MPGQRTTQHMRQDIQRIFHDAVAAVEPATAVHNTVVRHRDTFHIHGESYDLQRYRHLYVVGAGKASATMAQGLEAVLGDRIHSGAITVKYGHSVPLTHIQLTEADHPLPDAAGMRGAVTLMQVAAQATRDDLVFCLLSGGGSALLPAPQPGITLEEKQQVTNAFLTCGATIHEINTVRKHLSCLKGGQLARLVAPATLITLVLSDVVGDHLDVIASGPTVPDPTTYQDCLDIITRYNLRERLPASVMTYLKDGQRGRYPETPKPGEAVFARAQTVLVGSNRLALQAAEATARAYGYTPLLFSAVLTGESRQVASHLAALAHDIQHLSRPIAAPACILAGGETTVTIRGSGKGGRNQEFALAAALAIAGTEQIVVLSGGTDGTDGPTSAAGAVADGDTVARAQALGLVPAEFLERNDSYHFFQALDDLLITGPTGTNVMDVYLLLVGTPALESGRG